MAGNFQEHPRKKIVREVWDTPVLQKLHRSWGCKYLYFGLPGPKALDVKLWKDMIGRVIAFERENGYSNPVTHTRRGMRQALEKLKSRLDHRLLKNC